MFLDRYIKFPTGNDLERVVKGFEEKQNMVQYAGLIDDIHVPVWTPALSHTDYYNHKGWYSIILQAVVDHEYSFRDANVRLARKCSRY